MIYCVTTERAEVVRRCMAKVDKAVIEGNSPLNSYGTFKAGRPFRFSAGLVESMWSSVCAERR